MSRKLASIQKIVDIQPIPGADAIEVVSVLGWHCVAKKGEYSIGSLILYIEVDSLLPLREEFSFLEKGSGIKKMLVDGKEVQGYRVKTIKLRGQISQGIVFPVTTLGPKFPHTDIKEGDDVTDFLGVYKYEIPLPADLAGRARGGFPGFLPKTDEPRLQGNPEILEKYKDIPFYITEKMDGSSTTFVIKNDEFHVCGRTIDWLDDGKNSIWQVAKELDLESKMRNADLSERIALQGEIVGPGIQKNTLKLSKPTIYFYNAFDFSQGEYVSYDDFILLIHSMGLETVPVISDDFKLLSTVDEMVTYATRRSIKNPDVWLEGIVVRPRVEIQDVALGRLSFKVINPEFLLKNE